MRILILNWRDIKNPRSGGAEVLTHEIAKRWVDLGNTVTLFSSYFKGAKKREVLDGVRIIREGHPDARSLFLSVHFQAFLYYVSLKNKPDVVIDEVHGLPFFTSLYVKKKKIVLICEVADKLWIKMFGPIFGSIGKMLENIYLRFMYKSVPYLTISNSTKDELIKNGVNPQNITVLPMGITVPKKIKKVLKEKSPTLIFVGRISKPKGIEDVIKALRYVSKERSDIKLWVVGDGVEEYVNYLKKMAKRLKVSNKVNFFGYVSQEKKFELMGKAHILLAPSVKEGWGLIVPEAAYVGTSSIVYNSPGLRDVLKWSSYKIITKSNTPKALAEETVKFLDNKEYDVKKERLSLKDYSWDKTAKAALKVLKNE